MILFFLGFLILCGFLYSLQAADQWKGTSGTREEQMQAEVRYIIAIQIKQYHRACSDRLTRNTAERKMWRSVSGVQVTLWAAL